MASLSSNLALFKAAVRLKYDELCEDIDLKSILSTLFSVGSITTKQHEHLQQELQGPTFQAELFFRYLLDEDEEEKIDKFMEVVKEKQSWIHKLLEETMTAIAEGKMCDFSSKYVLFCF